MTRPKLTHVGDGRPAVVLSQVQCEWPGLQVTFRSDDISRPTDWRIREDRHAIVVHLGGRMDRLETELDGSGGSTGPALPGEVWTAPAGRSYASHARGGRIHYAVAMLDPAARDTILETRDGGREFAPVAGRRDEFLHQGIRQLESVAGMRDDVSLLLSESLSRTIALHLCRNYMGGRTEPLRKARPPLLAPKAARELREYVRASLSERVTLAKLAALAGLNKHQLLIAFRQAFGTTPAQYVISQRLRRVQQQLTETRRDITTIALDAGFSSHSHLTTCFRRQFGCSPSSFRASASRRRSGASRLGAAVDWTLR